MCWLYEITCKLSQSWDYLPLFTSAILFCATEGLTPADCISQAAMTTDLANGGHMWDIKGREKKKAGYTCILSLGSISGTAASPLVEFPLLPGTLGCCVLEVYLLQGPLATGIRGASCCYLSLGCLTLPRGVAQPLHHLRNLFLVLNILCYKNLKWFSFFR